jgi:hypothetical protein
VSSGYRGRITDVALLEHCGFSDKLPTGCGVMADCGFKNIDRQIASKSCHLVKPPSVFSGQKSSKESVIQTKQIANLRINIERVIRRLHEFEFLKPHSVIHSKLIGFTDDVVIACGLINLQPPIIRK